MSQSSMHSNLTNRSNDSQTSSQPPGSGNAIPYYWCVFYGALAVAIIVSNAFILVAFARKRKLRTRTNVFITGLVSSDLLVGTICLPSYMFILLYQRYSTHVQSSVHDNAYRVWMMLDIFGAAASAFHLVAISLERCYSVKWPLRHRVSSRQEYYVVLAFVWCLATVSSSTAVPFATWKHYPLAMTLSVYCFSFCVIVLSYIGIFHLASRSNGGNKTNRKTRCKENKITISVLLIIGLFWLSWTPFVVMNLVYWFCQSCAAIPPSAIFAFKALQYSNSLANPVIYTLRLPNFRQAIHEILFKDSRLKKGDTSLKPSGTSGINWGRARSRMYFQNNSRLWSSFETVK